MDGKMADMVWNFFPLIKFILFVTVGRSILFILGLQPRDKAAMLVVNAIEFFLTRIYMKIELSSQRREMLLFLTPTHHQNDRRDVTCKPAMSLRPLQERITIKFRKRD